MTLGGSKVGVRRGRAPGRYLFGSQNVCAVRDQSQSILPVVFQAGPIVSRARRGRLTSRDVRRLLRLPSTFHAGILDENLWQLQMGDE